MEKRPNQLDEDFAEAMAELHELIGLESVKRAVENIVLNFRRTLSDDVFPGLYCFVGNPGVGKTMVARLMGRILKAAEVLESGHVVERTAQQMASDYQNYEKALSLAQEGLLFIDGVHHLLDTAAGREVMERLLIAHEDTSVNKKMCIILADYPYEMDQMFRRDPSIQTRLVTRVVFRDYTPEELLQIMGEMASHPGKYPQIGTGTSLILDEGFRNAAYQVFQTVCNRHDPNFGNARFVRYFLHDSVMEQLSRLNRKYDDKDEIPEETRTRLTAEDIPVRFKSISTMKLNSANLDWNNIRTDAQAPVTSQNYRSRVEDLARGAVFLEIVFDSGSGSGSGTIISKDGYVLTANHIVQDANGKLAKSIKAKLYTPGEIGGDSRIVDCEILEDRRLDCDMALLKLKGVNYPSAPIRPLEFPIDNTEEIFMIRYPLGARLTNRSLGDLTHSQSEGRVMSVQNNNGVKQCYADIKGLHGDSGAGIYSKEDGRLIGVFTGSIIPDRKNSLDEINFFYPIEYFWTHFSVTGERLENKE